MGPVKEGYMYYEKTGDQFFGWTVSGLYPLSIKFAVGPPHFNLTTNEEIEILDDTMEAFVGEKGKKKDRTNMLLYLYAFCFFTLS